MSLALADSRGLQQDLAKLEDEQLAQRTVASARAFEMARADLVRCADEMDKRRSFEHEGYLSVTSWLRDKCRLTLRSARAIVTAARSLRSMPTVSRAYSTGELTFPAVQLLGIAAAAHPKAFADHEEMLVEQASVLSPSSLRNALDYWRQAADEDAGVAAAELKHQRRRLFISKTIDGMVRLDGDFDPEGGAMIIAAVRSLSEGAALDPGDRRSGPQRRADALTDLCRAHLDGDSDGSTGEKPHLSLIVDLETLVAGKGTVSEFEDGMVIDAETARRIACDASISRVIISGDSVPLDVGRKTRVVSAGLRRALVVRDRGCTYAGCDRPPQWCDAHHIEPWATGGPTSLDNLRLLCRRHHRKVHLSPAGPDP